MKWCQLSVLILAMGLTSCREEATSQDVELITRRRVTYVTEQARKVTWAGIQTESPASTLTVQTNGPVFPRSTILWGKAGESGQIASPGGAAYYAGWVENNSRLIVIAMQGVFEMAPQAGTSRAVWQPASKPLLKPMLAISRDNRQAAVTGYDVEADKPLIAVIDLHTGVAETIYIDGPVRGLAFSQRGKAHAVVDETLVVISPDDAGQWLLVEKGLAPGQLVGVQESAPAYVVDQTIFSTRGRLTPIDSDQPTGWISCDGLNLYIRTPAGEVYESVSPEPREIASFDPETILSSGVTGSGYWVAFEDGEIRIFDEHWRSANIVWPWQEQE